MKHPRDYDSVTDVDAQVARRVLADYGLELGQRVAVSVLVATTGETFTGSFATPSTLEGTITHATGAVLIIDHDDEARIRFPWHAIALIRDRPTIPPHPATT